MCFVVGGGNGLTFWNSWVTVAMWSLSPFVYFKILGCILLELFWLFLFRFRNTRIHGISISKKKNASSEYGISMAEVTWKPLCLHTRGRPRRISRQKFPKRTRILSIPSKPYSFHSLHSAIGSRVNRMIFRSFGKRNRSQQNTNTVYSKYSYSGIVQKERALKWRKN